MSLIQPEVPLQNSGQGTGEYVKALARFLSDWLLRAWREITGQKERTAALEKRKICGKPLTGDVSLTAADVGALDKDTVIPTDDAQLANGAGYAVLSELRDESRCDGMVFRWNSTVLAAGFVTGGLKEAYCALPSPLPQELAEQYTCRITAPLTLRGRGVSGFLTAAQESWSAADTQITISGTELILHHTAASAYTGTTNTPAAFWIYSGAVTFAWKGEENA